MDLGICGLAGSGKTTLFNVLSGTGRPVGAFDQQPNLAMVEVPDPRLDFLFAHFEPRRKVNATFRVTDFPGLVPGHASSDILARMRAMDALLIVGRAFECEAYPHPSVTNDPARDVAELTAEFNVADLAVLEKRLERLSTIARKPGKKEEAQVESELLERLLAHLDEHETLAGAPLSPDERKRIGSFAPLTLIPALVVLNADEIVETPPPGAVVINGKLEAEIMELAPDERAEFLEAMGLEPARGRLIHGAYELLGYSTFFTVGKDEVRAWTVRRDENVVEAARKIHDDLGRGFIRANVYRHEDLVELGSEKAIKEAGRMRVEGREYRVADGDVIEVLFSV